MRAKLYPRYPVVEHPNTPVKYVDLEFLPVASLILISEQIQTE